MASKEEHERDCIRELGEAFPEVHLWLDELFPKLGPRHRLVRHHVNGIAEIRQRWGDQAAKAAEIHIRKDFYGQIPSMADIELWSVLES